MASLDGQRKTIKIGILTVSDRCFHNEATDESGKNLCSLIENKKLLPGDVEVKTVVPDEESQIRSTLLNWSDNLKLDLILTTGGTGFSPRDVTPEATKAVLTKEALGLTVAMLKQSLEITPLAMLSRLVCGTRGTTLIINLPGSVKGSEECLRIVQQGIPHAIDLLHGNTKQIQSTHAELQSRGVESVCRRAVENSSVGSDFTTFKKPFYRTNRRRNIQYSLATNTFSCIREDLDEKGYKVIMSSKKRDSYTPCDENSQCGDKTNERKDSTGHEKQSGDISYNENNDKDTPGNENQRADKSCDDLTSQGLKTKSLSMTSLNSLDGITFENDVAFSSLQGPPSNEGIRVESPAFLGTPTRTTNGDTCFNLKEKHLPPSSIITFDRFLDERGETPTRILGKDIKSCLEMLENSDDDEEFRIDSPPHSDDESTIPYAESDPELMEEDELIDSPPEVSSQTHGDKQAKDMGVYEFDSDVELMSPPSVTVVKRSAKQASRIRKMRDENSKILHAKLHRTSMYGEVIHVEVGLKVYEFLKEHPLIQGIYLNRGKRHVKKQFVTLRREETAINEISWQRGDQMVDRNRFDDYFELTEEGKRRKSQLERKLVRDEYVVSWYMWCPGHGNCIRKCGGRGRCLRGCSGMKNKQDRHNCKVMVTFKLFLSDLTKWRVQITGLHVPKDSKWIPPDPSIHVMAALAKEKVKYVNSEKPAAIREILIDNFPRRKIYRYLSQEKRRTDNTETATDSPAADTADGKQQDFPMAPNEQNDTELDASTSDTPPVFSDIPVSQSSLITTSVSNMGNSSGSNSTNVNNSLTNLESNFLLSHPMMQNVCENLFAKFVSQLNPQDLHDLLTTQMFSQTTTSESTSSTA